MLGHGSILTLTSLANRTSPVQRGKYVMEVLIGSPPPAPPPAVPPLKEAVDNQKVLSVRDRMIQHRQNPVCAACHQMMDPIGLTLENFDAIGRWRTRDSGYAVDPSATMYDGTVLDGPASLRQAVLNRSDAFIGTFTEHLLSYGLGRVLDSRDMPTVRSIAREAASNDNRDLVFHSRSCPERAFPDKASRRPGNGRSVEKSVRRKHLCSSLKNIYPDALS